MMRVTPFRFTTLQFSQIGFTLLRTFTGAPVGTIFFGQDLYSNGLKPRTQGSPGTTPQNDPATRDRLSSWRQTPAPTMRN